MQVLGLPGADVGKGTLSEECNRTPAPHPSHAAHYTHNVACRQLACADEPALKFGSHHFLNFKEDGSVMQVKRILGIKIIE
jgi:hypothetical protein